MPSVLFQHFSSSHAAEELEGLKAELPTYLAKATGVAPNLSCLDWWNQSKTSLPYWSAAARRVL